MRILEVQTEHTQSFKTLIEVLKDMLPETNIEFKIDKKNCKKTDEQLEAESNNTENDNDNENGDNNDDTCTDADQKKGVDTSGIRILAVDTTKTVLINMKLEKKHFSKFKCAKSKISLGVNLSHFYKLIKSVDKDEHMTIFVDDENPNYMGIILDNPARNKRNNMEMKLLDLDNEYIDIPEIKFDAVMQINASEFHKLCREMKQLSENIEIICSANKIEFICKGGFANKKATYEKDENNGDSIDIKFSNNCPTKIIQGIYDLNNLVLFGKCSVLCGDIQLYMKNDYPLVIKYILPKLGRILLCLTPLNNDNKQDNFEDNDVYYSDEDVEYK
jgi:proliferating cell nuclear antigen